MIRARLLLLAGVAALAVVAGCDKKADAPTPVAKTVEAPASVKAAPALCEHGVPADQCTRCDPALAETFKALGDWCDEHGLPESHCKQCNPGLTFTATAEPADWCAEHAVPESKCTKCHPKLIAQYIEAGDYCREHGFPESVCPYCHPERVKAVGKEPPSFPPPDMQVRLATAQTSAEAGIRTAPAQKKQLAQSLEVVGQLDFNRNEYAQLTSRGDALVEEVKVDVGDDVKKGQPLVVLTSSSVGTDQAKLSAARSRIEAARAAVEREQRLVSRGISPQSALDQARSELAAAQAEYDGAQASLNSAGASGANAAGRYTLRAPFDGTVVARHVVAGRTTQPGETLIEVADLETVWAQLDIPEGEAHQVRPGQKVELRLDGANAPVLKGTISRVAASIDPRTRTVKARVELPNPDRTLRAGHFLRARIEISGERAALLIPADAVQTAEGQELVFVATGEGLYKPMKVKLGARSGSQVEVLEGISEGAQVVTTGAFLLKTEILKESIGAGCCEVGGEE